MKFLGEVLAPLKNPIRDRRVLEDSLIFTKNVKIRNNKLVFFKVRDQGYRNTFGHFEKKSPITV